MTNSGARDHYFSAAPAAPSKRGSTRLTLPDLTLDLVTDRGVFSGNAVDPGTKILLSEDLAMPDRGAAAGADLLDLGCGYGPIAVTLACRAANATVWAVDVNERALELTAENAAAAGVGDRVRACLPDAVPASVVFAGLWSNPPIRIGKHALHEMLERWLGRLAPDGNAWLVVQKHLGSDSLAAWLAQTGYAVARVRSRGGYRVLHVRPGAQA